MGDFHPIHQHAFNDREAAVLRTAFDLAWDRLSMALKTTDAEQMRRRLATAVMVIAGAGETDPDAMADRALMRCAKGLF